MTRMWYRYWQESDLEASPTTFDNTLIQIANTWNCPVFLANRPATGLSSGRDRSPMVIYAFRRGVSNRPARGGFISRTVSGDCVGEVQGEACGGLVAEGRVRPLSVIVGDPGNDQIAGAGQVLEQRLVQMA